MTLRYEPIEAHYVHSQRLILHAEEKLAEGDRIQASEKAWGAVAHYFKHLAAQRGWRYVTHADAFRISDRLAAELEEPRVKTLFSVANSMHGNFYQDQKSLDHIGQEIEEVKALLDILRRGENSNGR
ncbi:MAG: hypothetical protein F4Y49_06565 [Dehalococcoidia bacterium]|nr:hypothetical protein [Dehalococcoidia bacterium]MYH12868.1 hypothetical protein [Rhodothermaceae bacterium]